MAKIDRKIKSEGHEINLDTGEVDKKNIEAWPPSLRNKFIKCCSLVEQIVERKMSLIDETNITIIAHSLANFQEKGQSLFNQLCLFQTEYDTFYLQNLW